MLELPAVLGAVQRGELEAVVGENTGERVKKGPFKQKKVKVYLNLKSYTEHEKETKQQSKLMSYFPAHGTVKWRDTDFPKTVTLVLKTMQSICLCI